MTTRYLYRIYEPIKSCPRFGYSKNYDILCRLEGDKRIINKNIDTKGRLVIESTTNDIDELKPHWRASIRVMDD